MIHAAARYQTWPLAGAVLLAALGCAGSPRTVIPFSPPAETTLTEQRKVRASAAADAFERQRQYAQLQSARAAFERGDLRACEGALRPMIGRPTAPVEARLMLADVLLATDRRAEAVKQIELALRDEPDDPAALHAMGLLLDAAGQRQEAQAYYERAVQQAPDNDVYLTSYAMVQQTEAPDTHAAPLPDIEGAPPVAIMPEAVEPISSGASGEADASTNPAQSGRRGKLTESVESTETVEPDVSIATPQIVSETNGETRGATEVQMRLADAERAFIQGDPGAAVETLRRVVAACPDNPRTPLNAAVLALKYNQPDLAAELLRPAVVRFPKHAPLHRALGVAHYRRGQLRQAEVALRQALSLDKSDPLTYLLLGCTLAKLGQPDAARQQWQLAERLDPRYGNVRR